MTYLSCQHQCMWSLLLFGVVYVYGEKVTCGKKIVCFWWCGSIFGSIIFISFILRNQVHKNWSKYLVFRSRQVYHIVAYLQVGVYHIVAYRDRNFIRKWTSGICRVLVFVKDSILGNWSKYERRRREENRARESAGGERRAQRAFRRRRKRFREAESSLCYYGQIPIAFKSRYLSKLNTPLYEEAQIYCPTWLSMQQYSFHSWKTPRPEPGYRVSSSRKCPLAACYFYTLTLVL